MTVYHSSSHGVFLRFLSGQKKVTFTDQSTNC
jgi:hypothetical protein